MDFELPLAPPLRIRLEDPPTRVARFLEAELGGARTGGAGRGPADVTVRFVESLTPPAEWDRFGLSMAIADGTLEVIEGDRRARIALSDSGRVAAEVERLMPLDSVRRRVVLPCVALAALKRDAVVLHASATRGPLGTVLLLGEQGVGKTGLVVDLVAAGHGYVADDQLLLTRDAELIGLQGLLALRIDTLAARKDLGRQARSTGWRTARALRSVLRASRRLTARIPSSIARQMTGALQRMDDALSAHCFFLEPERVFPPHEECPAARSIRGFLITVGTPALAEPASEDLAERWVLDAVRVAHEPLTELLTYAARTSRRWERVLADSLCAQRTVVGSAVGRMAFTRLRIEPQSTGSEAARLIAELADTPGSTGGVAGTA